MRTLRGGAGLRLLLLTAFAMGLLFLVGMLMTPLLNAHAEEISSCSYDSVSGHVVITLKPGPHPYDFKGVYVRREGQSIQYWTPEDFYRYRSCDGATVTNTDLITFNDESAGNAIDGAFFNIDQSKGLFAPGRTDEVGLSEIEFDLNFAQDDGSYTWHLGRIWIDGTDAGDRIIGGERGLKLNPDDDLDVRAVNHGAFKVFTGHGPDVVHMNGRYGTGRFEGSGGQDHSVEMIGGRGRDTLQGGPYDDEILGVYGADHLIGGRGVDQMFGSSGADHIKSGRGHDIWVTGGDGVDFINSGPGDDRRVQGDPGTDVIRGGAGDDSGVDGGRGDDQLKGGSGDDTLLGSGGNDQLDGNKGKDICRQGPGRDVQVRCEL